MAKSSEHNLLTPQEMQELLSSLPREAPFRYSNRFVFYLVWMGGWSLFALWALFFGEGFTNSVAIPLIDRFGAAGFVGVMIFIAGSYVGFFLFFFFLARRTTDKHGTAYFHDDFVELHIGGRRLKIAYGEIRRLKYRTVLNAQHGGTGFGPMLYRLHIRTERRKIVIPCSFMEAWECRRAGDIAPTIDALCFQLHVRSGVGVKFVAK
ncbi:hypothetical protein LJC32_02595 [Oscillospiraceae bacterium OttesenSCG-928-F05]|nr:hypothetical protein [Oscillospiraceae bacterium OttesenSCG-928-F05]